jgi:hypothetical protein
MGEKGRLADVTTFIALASMFFAGAWWDGERKASLAAMAFAALMLAIGATT